MPWPQSDAMQERTKFVLEWEARWKANEGRVNISELCRIYGVSRETGYVSINRYRNAGHDLAAVGVPKVFMTFGLLPTADGLHDLALETCPRALIAVSGVSDYVAEGLHDIRLASLHTTIHLRRSERSAERETALWTWTAA